MIESGKKVTVNYTGKFENNEVFDTSLQEGREPLSFTMGAGEVIPGFEKGVMEMEVGQTKTIEIEAQHAYGEINEDLKQEVPKENVPENVEVGMQLQTMVGNQPIPVQVTEVKESTVVVDANHPMAGKKLIFDLELVGVE
jgi:FKBP-type peptidyl-prolyl cis-trans isomerase 2